MAAWHYFGRVSIPLSSIWPVEPHWSTWDKIKQFVWGWLYIYIYIYIFKTYMYIYLLKVWLYCSSIPVIVKGRFQAVLLLFTLQIIVQWVECSPMIREIWVQSQVASYQKTWYLMPPCLTLSNMRYVSWEKWSNPGKGVAFSPTPRCSSYWKGSLLVALDYGRQLTLKILNTHTHIYIYICITCL